MKTGKRFQSEAALAGFQTLEELNSAFSAWLEVEYNAKVHSHPRRDSQRALVEQPEKELTQKDHRSG